MITVVGSLKGGSGKSTVTINLAVWLTLAECDVQVIDLDPQATLRDVAEVRQEEGYKPSISVKGKKDLDVEKLIKADEVLIDIGTADLETMKKAISMADRIVVPVPPSQADIWSTQRFLKIVLSVIDKKKKPEILGFINRADTHIGVRETGEAEEALQLLPNIDALSTRLYQRTAYRRSFSEGLAVFEQDPMGKAAREMKKLAKLLYK